MLYPPPVAGWHSLSALPCASDVGAAAVPAALPSDRRGRQKRYIRETLLESCCCSAAATVAVCWRFPHPSTDAPFLSDVIIVSLAPTNYYVRVGDCYCLPGTWFGVGLHTYVLLVHPTWWVDTRKDKGSTVDLRFTPTRNRLFSHTEQIAFSRTITVKRMFFRGPRVSLVALLSALEVPKPEPLVGCVSSSSSMGLQTGTTAVTSLRGVSHDELYCKLLL